MRYPRFKYLPSLLILLLAIVPVFSQNDSLSKKQLSFDFGITRGQNINLWPLFKKYKSEERRELQILFPLYSQKKNYAKHTRHFRLLPFVISDSSVHGRDWRFLSLYYPTLLHVHRQHDSAGIKRSFSFLELAPHISFLGFSRSPGGLVLENNLFFFIWYRKDALEGKTKFVVFPAYWQFDNQKRSTRLLFPLWLKTSTASSRYLNIAFLYNHKRSPTLRKNILFPLWWHKTSYANGDTTRRYLLLPLYWSKANALQSRQLLFPLMYRSKNEHYRSFTLFPFFSAGSSSDAATHHLVVTPLFWHTQLPFHTTHVFFPLYWHLKKYGQNDTTKRVVLFPLYWSKRNREINNKVFFPLVYSFNNPQRHSLTVFPIFSEGHRKDSGSWRMISPFYWHFETPRSVKNVLFPLYWNTDYYTKRDTIHKEVFFPLYWSNQRKNESRTVLFPLYWHTQTPDKDNHVIFPFIYHLKNRYYQSFTAFPLYSSGAATDSSSHHRVVALLYWHIQTNHGLTDAFLPILWRSTRYKRNDTIIRKGIAGLYWTVKSKEKNNRILFPFVYSIKNKNRQSLTIFPLFSYGHWHDSSRRHIGITPLFWRFKEKGRVTNTFFPLYWHVKNTRFYDTSQYHVLFPLLWIVDTKHKHNRVLFPFVFHIHNQYKNTFTFFPLFSFGQRYKTKLQPEQNHLVITPLFWHSRSSAAVKNTLFPLYWQRTWYGKEDTLHRHVFFPLYWHKKTATERSTILLPLVYHFRDTLKSSFTIFPLVSYRHAYDGSKSHLVVTPLFWRYRSPQRSGTIFFPLYWEKKKFEREDTTLRRVFFPLYWSYHNKEKSRFLFIPFIFRQKNTAYRSFTFFPLFSAGHATHGAKRHLLITPLFGRLSSEKQTHTFLFPLFDSHRSTNEKRFSLLLFLFTHTSRLNYSKTNLLWPIYQQVRDSSRHKLRVAPLLWYAKTDSSNMLAFIPLFYSHKSQKKNTFILSVFLYKRDRVYNVSVANSFLWRLYYHKNYSNGDFERRFLHLVAANVKVEGHREKSVLPFFHTIKEADGSWSVSYFFGFYNHFREYKPQISDFYEEERIFWFIRLRSNYRQLKSEGKDGFIRHKRRHRQQTKP